METAMRVLTITTLLLVAVTMGLSLAHALEFPGKLALWPRTSLAKETGLPVGTPCATELSIGHNVTSKEEVDVVMQQAKRAGAVIVKQAQDTFWGGYAGYFQDPDQHLWEIAWNPQLLPQE
jgi:catechol 2,3-dioxygenase-like lactoylglutathione lyase family enzyme